MQKVEIGEIKKNIGNFCITGYVNVFREVQGPGKRTSETKHLLFFMFYTSFILIRVSLHRRIDLPELLIVKSMIHFSNKGLIKQNNLKT